MKYEFNKDKLNEDFINGAAEDNKEKVFLAMVKGADMNTISWDNGFNALHWAMHNGSLRTLTILVDISKKDRGRFTSFWHRDMLIAKYADEFGGKERLRKIWEQQASMINVYHRDFDGNLANKQLPKPKERPWEYGAKDAYSKHMTKVQDFWSMAKNWAYSKHCKALTNSKYVSGEEHITEPALVKIRKSNCKMLASPK